MTKPKQFLKLLVPPLFLLIRIQLLKLLDFFLGHEIENAYSSPLFLDHYISRGESFKNQLNAGRTLSVTEVTPALGFLLIRTSSPITVLDFGGGTGNRFHILQSLFPDTELNWNVIETPELVRQISPKLEGGKTTASTSVLRFSSNLADFTLGKQKIDIVIAGSSLQYISDPYSKLLELINLEAGIVHISRMPLTQQEDLLVFNQISRLDDNGPQGKSAARNIRVSNRVYIPNLKKFESIMSLKYSHVIVLIETLDGYPDSKHRVPLYSLIAFN